MQRAILGRAASSALVSACGQSGVRTAIVALVPSVHGEGAKGFVPKLIIIARTKGISAYIGDGSNRCPTVHRLDAGHLFRLALEAAPAEARLDGVGDEGVPFLDVPRSSIQAQELLGWRPVHPGLIADLEQGRYLR